MTDNIEDYNSDITFEELSEALNSLKPTTPGIDNIHLDMLKNLSISAKSTLLEIFSSIWKNHVYPDIWCKSITIPILKPLKDKMRCASYRPISITSSVSKLMESIVTKRVKFKINQLNILSKFQCGFRQRHSTIDHLVRLETEICNAVQS